jgi:hypothetical protein
MSIPEDGLARNMDLLESMLYGIEKQWREQ